MPNLITVFGGRGASSDEGGFFRFAAPSTGESEKKYLLLCGDTKKCKPVCHKIGRYLISPAGGIFDPAQPDREERA